MASPTLSYTLSNGSTADASQVMTNLNDILNGVTDGSKDLSISALTCAGTATFNGAVTLGNATADDITVTGYVASNVLPKTNATYDLGSSAQNWQALYVDDGTTTGGTIYFDAGTSEYIQSNAAGTILTIAGFTSGVEIKGTTAGNNTTAGYVGEYTIASRLRSASAAATSATTHNITASPLSLTAGDWDVCAAVEWDLTSATVSEASIGISQTSATLPGTDVLAVPTSGEFRLATTGSGDASSDDISMVTPPVRISLSATTNIYLVGSITFTGTSASYFGSIWARRVR